MSDDFNVILSPDNQAVVYSEPQTSTSVSTDTATVNQVTYIHTQSSASSSWTITHNLGRRPSVTVVDSGGNVQIGEVLYTSDNEITVSFAAAFGGYAYLN